MPLKDKMTALANGFRKAYDTDIKLSLDQMIQGVSNLNPPNLVSDVSYDSTVDTKGLKKLNGLTVDVINSNLLGKTVTISCDVDYSGFKIEQGINNRFGIEYGLEFNGASEVWLSAWMTHIQDAGTAHLVKTYVLPSVKCTGINEGYIYDQTSKDAKIKISNVKIFVNPMGGGVATVFLVQPFDFQTIGETKNTWSTNPFASGVYLDKGTYTYSVDLDTSQSSNHTSLRINQGTGKLKGTDAYDGAELVSKTYSANGSSDTLAMTFDVTTPGTFSFLLGGAYNPFAETSGIKYRNAKLIKTA